MEAAATSKSKFELRLSSSTIVAADDDLLAEILIRLPIKSLLRFKSVSIRWLSLISNPQFCHRKNQSLGNAISGFLLHHSSFSINPEFEFVSLDEYQPVNPPFKSLTFVEDRSGIKILQSCNGLLLCRSFRVHTCKCNYYIFNPTTRKFTTLPDPLHRDFVAEGGTTSVYAVNLAFDPRKSPYYKVICIYFSKTVPDYLVLEIYSSQTGLWKHIDHASIDHPFDAEVNFDIGVYWNGAINWMSAWADSFYFSVDEERFGTLPMLPIPDGWEDGRRIRYFGESNDHLHLIEIYGPRTTQFNVYEMDREYSGWFVKYIVDLEAVMNAFPESICHELDPSDLHYYRFLFLGVVRRKDDADSFLILNIPGTAIRYNFGDKSFKKLTDFAPDSNFGHPLMFGWYNSFEFIQSMASV